ncbi:MAG: DUF99 family protein [Thermofilum sp.]
MGCSGFVKPAFRVLGVAECFRKSQARSVVAAVSYRRDRVIDGVYLTFFNVGGLDATEKIISLVRESGRKDFNVIMVNGCVLSWFNVLDLKKIHEGTGIPVMCLTYEESSGLERFIKEYFPGDTARMRMYLDLGERELVYVRAARSYVYVRYQGLTAEDVRKILDSTTLTGRVPEPLRTAQTIARAVHSFLESRFPEVLGTRFSQPA